jgi:hypothetical protein
MDNWITIISFTYPHEAHLAKGKLESEGVEVIIKDELTVQVNNFYSNAIGGVKLLVRDFDYDNANQILVESGYIKEKISLPNKFWTRFDKLTSKLPLIGESIIELRLIIIVALILIIISIPIVFLSLPSTVEKLTENSWCVEKIYYKGQELIPNSLGIKMESYYDNCSEIMSFRENGIVDFPGINAYGERARWEIRNDSLIITSWSIDNNITIDTNLKIIEKGDALEKSIYPGTYSLEIKDNTIKMQSDSLIIFGKVYRSNFIF